MMNLTERNGETARAAFRIIIVDDHPLVRQGYRQLLSQEPGVEVCAEANGMNEALELCRQHQPDLLLVDISLRDGSGIELIKEIKATNPEIRIVVASMHDESLFAERALRAGAMGYINKQESGSQILEAVRRVRNGKIYVSRGFTDRMLCRAVGANETGDRSPLNALSDRELQVFELIGQGETTRRIAARLSLSPKTVETYRENIKAKLNLENGTQLTRQAVQWVLQDS